ncbi:MAG TPA: class I SAM-dependent methyltransferase [Candidatus Binatia bacterium]|nr:class I SAM-dependent methyltransferase [Candidatus Binatia bacterium]
MRDGSPSATAQRAAVLRAVHHRYDRPRVLDDPVAIRLLDRATATVVETDLARFDTPALRRLRATIAFRSRYAEDALHDAVERGVAQYVVLGAGLDTFAYRSPLAAALRVFEVDHPETQAWKRARLRTAGIDPPAALRFVPTNFEREPFVDALVRGGLDTGAPTFVAWLGVTIYLSRDAIRRTLAALATLAPGSAVVFDYSVPADALPAPARSARASMAARAADAGEPWLTYFDPSEAASTLCALGLTVREDVGPDQAIDRYFRMRDDGLRPGTGARLVRATIG